MSKTLKNTIQFLTFFTIFSLITQLSWANTEKETNANDNKFLIKDIIVDQIADSAEEARNAAVKYAQEIAFKTLLKNLFDDDSEITLPDQDISNIVQAIEYKNEVITDRRYKALIDVYFRPEQTEYFINTHYLNKRPKKLNIMVIPLYNENGMIKLWQKGNLWFEVWNSLKKSDMVNLKIPLGDIDDMINFRVSDLGDMDKTKATELAQTYQVDKIVIAELNYNYQTISPEINFEASLRELGDIENNTLIAKSDGFKSDDYFRHLSYLAEKIVANLELGWVSYNNDLDESHRQNFIIKSQNIEDWLDIKKRLTSLPIIKSFKVDSFAARYSKITIEFSDNALLSLNNFRDMGFKISRKNNYVILETK